MTSMEYLESLAMKTEWKDGLHLGVANDKLAIELEYGRKLYDMVFDLRPGVIFEIGTGFGYSTSWMLMALNENKRGKIYTVDHEIREPAYWKEAQIPDKRLVRLFGSAEKVSQIPGKIDFVFHDSSHRIEHIVPDLELIMPRISKGGQIVVHDTNYARTMGDELKEFFKKKTDWSYFEMEKGCGLGIAEKTGRK